VSENYNAPDAHRLNKSVACLTDTCASSLVKKMLRSHSKHYRSFWDDILALPMTQPPVSKH